jgi:hypothetical protein
MSRKSQTFDFNDDNFSPVLLLAQPQIREQITGSTSVDANRKWLMGYTPARLL